MMKFEHGGGLAEGKSTAEGKDSPDARKLPDGPCVSTKTPAGFDVGPLRERLRGWLGRDPAMTISDFVQTDASGCFGRATKRIPERWDVLTLQVSCQAPYAAFVETVTSKLGQKTFKARVCICEYSHDSPIAGPTSTFLNHWILIIGAGADTSGRKFLVVFDPDPNATERSKKYWAPHCKLDFDSAPVGAPVLEGLALGHGNKLGGLIRYFYA